MTANVIKSFRIRKWALNLLLVFAFAAPTIGSAAGDDGERPELPSKGYFRDLPTGLFCAVPLSLSNELVHSEHELLASVVPKRGPLQVTVAVVDSEGGTPIRPSRQDVSANQREPISVGRLNQLGTGGEYYFVCVIQSPRIPAPEAIASIGLRTTPQTLFDSFTVTPREGRTFKIGYVVNDTCDVELASWENGVKKIWSSPERTRTKGERVEREWKWDMAKSKTGQHQIVWAAKALKGPEILDQQSDVVMVK